MTSTALGLTPGAMDAATRDSGKAIACMAGANSPGSSDSTAAWWDAAVRRRRFDHQGPMVACTKENTSMTSRREILQERKMHVTTRESHVSRV